MKLSFVLPVYNESSIIKDFYEELHQHASKESEQIEYVFINDGSTDTSLEILKELKEQYKSSCDFKIINFSRNFGHQSAVTAGLTQVTGDVIVLMDTDLQDDPSAIQKFVSKWKEGYQVVYAVRSQRQEGVLLRFLFKSYYRIFSKITHIKVPNDAGNFGLVDRRVIDEINALPEHNRYFPGLRAWVGFRQTGVDVPRRLRGDGQAKVGVIGLFRLALDGIFSFSNFPLRLAFFIAFLLAILGVVGALFIVYLKLFTDAAVVMWASIMCSVLFIGAGQFFLIGLVGEYIGRIYSEVKRRPHFIIREIL